MTTESGRYDDEDSEDDRVIDVNPAKRAKLAISAPSGPASGDEQRPTGTTDAASTSTHYLDTINTDVLNFDYETVCSVSLTDVNVYSCLVCGRFFQGRSRASHAYVHAVNLGHHVFINMDTLRVYILPENKEIDGTGIKVIESIRYQIDPTYSKDAIRWLDGAMDSQDRAGPAAPSANAAAAVAVQGVTLDGKKYSPGYIGLNSNAANFVNVVIQVLGHIQPVRDYFLSGARRQDGGTATAAASEFQVKFGLLVRKLWSARLFRSHISAHEFLRQAQKLPNHGTGAGDEGGTPKRFLVWLLNQLHQATRQAPKSSKSIISKTCQGKIEVVTTPLLSRVDDLQRVEIVPDRQKSATTLSKYWILTLDLPATAAVAAASAASTASAGGDQDTNEIPQVSLESLLAKYDGHTTTQSSSTALKSYRLVAPLPPYLILHIDRNLEPIPTSGQTSAPGSSLSRKHNPTVVTFPLSLDMSPYVNGGAQAATSPLVYDLVANIKHDLVPGEELNHDLDRHEWTVRLQRTADEWVSIKDLQVDRCDKELMFLDESYILVWRRRR